MLDNSYNPPDYSVITAFAGVEITPIRKTHNDTYLGENCFIKVYGNSQRYLAELIAFEYLNTHLPMVPILDHQDQIIKYARAKDASLCDTALAARAAFAAHTLIDPKDVPLQWEDINDERINALKKYHKQLADDLITLTAKTQQMKRVVLHADIAQHNMVCINGKIAVIDWEWLHVGPLEWEFTAINLKEKHRPYLLEEMINNYEEKGQQVNRKNLAILSQIRELHSIAWSFEIGLRNPEYKVKADKYTVDYLKNYSK